MHTSLSIAMKDHDAWIRKRSQLHISPDSPDFPMFQAVSPLFHLRQYFYLIDVHSQTWTSWWFQPLWQILVKLDHFPKSGWTSKIIWNHQPVDLPYLSFFSDPFGYLEWLLKRTAVNSRWACNDRDPCHERPWRPHELGIFQKTTWKLQ